MQTRAALIRHKVCVVAGGALVALVSEVGPTCVRFHIKSTKDPCAASLTSDRAPKAEIDMKAYLFIFVAVRRVSAASSWAPTRQVAQSSSCQRWQTPIFFENWYSAVCCLGGGLPWASHWRIALWFFAAWTHQEGCSSVLDVVRFSGKRFRTRLHQRLPEQLACLRWLRVRHKSRRCTEGSMLGMLAVCPAVVVTGLTSVHGISPTKPCKQTDVLLQVVRCPSSGCVLGPKIDMAHHLAPPSELLRYNSVCNRTKRSLPEGKGHVLR